MKAYVIVTGAVFGLLTPVHLWRIGEEPPAARDPWFIRVSLAAAALAVASVRLARRSR